VVALFFHGAPSAANAPPNAPTWVEPDPGTIISAYDPHLNVNAFSDPDPGDLHLSTDFEIWDDSLEVRVWSDLDETVLKYHVHLGDGITEGPLAGETRLDFDRPYKVRARFRDNSGAVNSYSNWSVWVLVRTAPADALFPTLLRDVLPIAPVWKSAAGVAINLPSNATLRLLGVSSNLFRINGMAGTDTWTDFAPLTDHRALKVAYGAGSVAYSQPASKLTVVDADSLPRDIYLPAVTLTANQTRYFWIDDAGRSYNTTSALTTPDFSSLAQDLFMPWKVNFPSFAIERVVTNLYLPINIAFVSSPTGAPLDPYFYVTELYGKVKVVTRDFSVFTFADSLLNFDPMGNFPGSGELGITGICVEPATGDVFVTGIYDSLGQKYNRVQRLYASASGLAADSVRTILSGIPSAPSHEIEQCTIGPDGKLYVQVADALVADTTIAQDPNDLRGKVLRINLDGSAPADNPFGPTNKVWAVGFRNPFGGAWYGGKLYVSDNGEDVFDRVCQVVAGGDYGWCCDFTHNALHMILGGGTTAVGLPTAGFAGSAYAGNLFVGVSGATYAPGQPFNGKVIHMLDLNASGAVTSDSVFVRYVGAGYGTVVGVAFGPDGLYFTDLYGESGFGANGLTEANIYRVSTTQTSVESPAPGVSGLDALAVPNPTGNATTIRFDLPRGQRTAARVFDTSGRLVQVLTDGFLARGPQAVVWDGLDAFGRDAASGVYLIRIVTEDGAHRTARVTLVR
jgi:hypothetical protein